MIEKCDTMPNLYSNPEPDHLPYFVPLPEADQITLAIMEARNKKYVSDDVSVIKNKKIQGGRECNFLLLQDKNAGDKTGEETYREFSPYALVYHNDGLLFSFQQINKEIFIDSRFQEALTNPAVPESCNTLFF